MPKAGNCKRSLGFRELLSVALLCGLASPALAQGISGQVNDATSGVLPGVSVEAASPVLIEQVRVVFTDSEGRFSITDLRPGTYTVTFSLPGFGTVLREGIELESGFTATVDAELSVGALEETVTITGASPVVDVQNVTTREVITSEQLDTLPVSKSLESLVALVPGLTVSANNRDTGGSSGDRPSSTSIHGSRGSDQHIFYDGTATNNINSSAGSTGGGGGFSIYFNPASIAEIDLEVGQQSIQSESGGVTINVIPREGGNVFSGMILANGTNEDFQGTNLSDTLIAQGLTTVPRIKGIFDLNAGIGGPIVNDKLWFHAAYRRWGAESFVPGRFFSQDPLSFSVPIPDLDRQAYDQNLSKDFTVRFTNQASPNNKLSFVYTRQRRCLCYSAIKRNNTPEASTKTLDRSHRWHGKWTNTVTNRLLLQAGVSGNKMNWHTGLQPGVGFDIISVRETSTGLRYRAPAQIAGPSQDLGFNSSTYHVNLSATYVTGSHSFFVGSNILHARPTTDWDVNGDRTYDFFNGVPFRVNLRAMPQSLKNRLNDIGIFASDQWTLDRLTINAGIRYTSFAGSIPEQILPAGDFVPARNFAPIPDVVSWQDITPRAGIAYDLFGDARTALKVSVSKFLIGHAGDVINSANPQTRVADSASRAWTDANGNFEADCDLAAPGANGECGPISDVNFGQVTAVSTFRDRATREGWGSRDNNWEIATGIQRELAPGVSVEASYFRRWFGNFLVTDNRAVDNADFDPFCVTAPLDSRLPGGGGNEICGLYDINPSAFGQVDNFITYADNFGSRTEVYNGVDLLLDARLPGGASVNGGANIGRTATDDCGVRPDSPQDRFCNVTPKFLTDFKLSVSYPTVWDIQVAVAIQSTPGPEILAAQTYSSAEVAASLGRPLASGGRTTVALVEPGTLYADRLNEIDVRFSKTVRLPGYSIRGGLDVYNLTNAAPPLTVNNAFGPAWQRPFLTLPGRFVKFAVQLDF